MNYDPDDDDDLDPYDDFDDDFDEDDKLRPLWTRNRLLLIIVVIIIIVTLLAYTMQGLFLPSTPPPTLAPGSLI